MTRDEYIEECQGLIDSFDERVTAEDVALTLRLIADRVEAEGLEEEDDDEYDESADACPACDTLPSKCHGGCCEDCNHANSWHAGMATGSSAREPDVS